MDISLGESLIEDIWVCNSDFCINPLWLLAILRLPNYLHFTLTAMSRFWTTFMASDWNTRWRSFHHGLCFTYKCFQIWVLVLRLKVCVRFLGWRNCTLCPCVNWFDIQDWVVEGSWHLLFVVKLWIHTSSWGLVKWLCTAVRSYSEGGKFFLYLCFA